MMASKRKIILLDGIAPEKCVDLAKKIKALKGTVTNSKTYHKNFTHLVCDTIICSDKFFAACAKGAWVGSPQFVEDSFAVGKWLSESDYVHSVRDHRQSPELVAAVTRWRWRAQMFKEHPFSGWSVAVLMAGEEGMQWKRILSLGGAKIVALAVPLADNQNVSDVTYVIMDQAHRTSAVHLQEFGLICLHHSFVSDTILKDEDLDPFSYLILNSPADVEEEGTDASTRIDAGEQLTSSDLPSTHTSHDGRLEQRSNSAQASESSIRNISADATTSGSTSRGHSEGQSFSLKSDATLNTRGDAMSCVPEVGGSGQTVSEREHNVTRIRVVPHDSNGEIGEIKYLGLEHTDPGVEQFENPPSDMPQAAFCREPLTEDPLELQALENSTEQPPSKFLKLQIQPMNLNRPVPLQQREVRGGLVQNSIRKRKLTSKGMAYASSISRKSSIASGSSQNGLTPSVMCTSQVIQDKSGLSKNSQRPQVTKEHNGVLTPTHVLPKSVLLHGLEKNEDDSSNKESVSNTVLPVKQKSPHQKCEKPRRIVSKPRTNKTMSSKLKYSPQVKARPALRKVKSVRDAVYSMTSSLPVNVHLYGLDGQKISEDTSVVPEACSPTSSPSNSCDARASPSPASTVPSKEPAELLSTPGKGQPDERAGQVEHTPTKLKQPGRKYVSPTLSLSLPPNVYIHSASLADNDQPAACASPHTSQARESPMKAGLSRGAKGKHSKGKPLLSSAISGTKTHGKMSSKSKASTLLTTDSVQNSPAPSVTALTSPAKGCKNIISKETPLSSSQPASNPPSKASGCEEDEIDEIIASSPETGSRKMSGEKESVSSSWPGSKKNSCQNSSGAKASPGFKPMKKSPGKTDPPAAVSPLVKKIVQADLQSFGFSSSFSKGSRSTDKKHFQPKSTTVSVLSPSTKRNLAKQVLSSSSPVVVKQEPQSGTKEKQWKSWTAAAQTGKTVKARTLQQPAVKSTPSDAAIWIVSSDEEEEIPSPPKTKREKSYAEDERPTPVHDEKCTSKSATENTEVRIKMNDKSPGASPHKPPTKSRVRKSLMNELNVAAEAAGVEKLPTPDCIAEPVLSSSSSTAVSVSTAVSGEASCCTSVTTSLSSGRSAYVRNSLPSSSCPADVRNPLSPSSCPANVRSTDVRTSLSSSSCPAIVRSTGVITSLPSSSCHANVTTSLSPSSCPANDRTCLPSSSGPANVKLSLSSDISCLNDAVDSVIKDKKELASHCTRKRVTHMDKASSVDVSASTHASASTTVSSVASNSQSKSSTLQSEFTVEQKVSSTECGEDGVISATRCSNEGEKRQKLSDRATASDEKAQADTPRDAPLPETETYLTKTIPVLYGQWMEAARDLDLNDAAVSHGRPTRLRLPTALLLSQLVALAGEDEDVEENVGGQACSYLHGWLQLHPPVNPHAARIYAAALRLDDQRHDPDYLLGWIKQCAVPAESAAPPAHLQMLLKYFASVLELDFASCLKSGDKKLLQKCLVVRWLWGNPLAVFHTSRTCQLVKLMGKAVLEAASPSSPTYLDFSYCEMVCSVIGLAAECIRLSSKGWDKTRPGFDSDSVMVIAADISRTIQASLPNGGSEVVLVLDLLKPSWLRALVAATMLSSFNSYLLSDVIQVKGLSLHSIVSQYFYLVPLISQAHDSDARVGAEHHLRSANVPEADRNTSAGSKRSNRERKLADKEKKLSSMLRRKNCKGETALHTACIKDNAALLEELLSHPGVDVNVRDAIGWTPLHEACNHGSLRCVEVLLKYVPGPIHQQDTHEQTEVTAAARPTDNEAPADVNVSSAPCSRLRKADLNAAGPQDVTPLHDAVMNDRMEVCRLLLRYGGRRLLKARTCLGNSALDLATTLEMREFLEGQLRGPAGGLGGGVTAGCLDDSQMEENLLLVEGEERAPLASLYLELVGDRSARCVSRAHFSHFVSLLSTLLTAYCEAIRPSRAASALDTREASGLCRAASVSDTRDGSRWTSCDAVKMPARTPEDHSAAKPAVTVREMQDLATLAELTLHFKLLKRHARKLTTSSDFEALKPRLKMVKTICCSLASEV